MNEKERLTTARIKAYNISTFFAYFSSSSFSFSASWLDRLFNMCLLFYLKKDSFCIKKKWPP
jgi:putative flippase GtrA